MLATDTIERMQKRDCFDGRSRMAGSWNRFVRFVT
jgi:hypothetical protein